MDYINQGASARNHGIDTENGTVRLHDDVVWFVTKNPRRRKRPNCAKKRKNGNGKRKNNLNKKELPPRDKLGKSSSTTATAGRLMTALGYNPMGPWGSNGSGYR